MIEAQTHHSVAKVIELAAYLVVLIVIVGGTWFMFGFEVAQYVSVIAVSGFVLVKLILAGLLIGKDGSSEVAAKTLETVAAFNQTSSKDKQSELRVVAEMFKALKQDTMMQRQEQSRDWRIFQQEMKGMIEEKPDSKSDDFLQRLQQLRTENDSSIIDTEYEEYRNE